MNATDKMELDKCRQEMCNQFLKVASTEDKVEIEKFLEAMDRHQEILGKRDDHFDPNEGREC